MLAFLVKAMQFFPHLKGLITVPNDRPGYVRNFPNVNFFRVVNIRAALFLLRRDEAPACAVAEFGTAADDVAVAPDLPVRTGSDELVNVVEDDTEVVGKEKLKNIFRQEKYWQTIWIL